MKQDKTPLLDAINQLIDSKPAYFRIPGHRLDKGISSRWTKRTGTGIFAYDVTETPYTDDLHCPEGAIKEAEELLAELYKADRSFFLVNGTTCGNEAMILTAVHEGQKIMVARNAHKSAMMGLIISGAKPVYVMPDIIDEWGIQGGISPKQVRKTFEENPECKALFMVSPSYYGVVSDIEEIADSVVGFSDDGRGVQSDDMMREAMKKAKRLGKMIVAHCEVNDLLKGGYIHDGEYAKQHGHRGICSESEWKQIERDIALVRETGASYHVCHISAAESVEIIRQAKAEGLDVTCETAPHYLVLTDADLKEEGRFKMNPPLRSREDRDALIAGILDGTIDMIATDHAPHSAEEKSRGLEKSAFGVVGIETAFPICYTYLVKTGILSLEKLVDLLVVNPRKRFGIALGCDFSVWDLEEEYTVDPAEFVSLGKATPFEGWKVNGRCLATVCDGKVVYKV